MRDWLTNMEVKYIIILAMAFINVERVMLQRPSLGNDNNPSVFNIGGVLSTSESEDHFRDTIAVSSRLVSLACFLI